MPDTPALQTDALGHTYPGGARAALDGVTLEVSPGDVFGVLGPNGGGKTTLFRIFSTRLTPTDGSAAVTGHDVNRDPAGARWSLGVVFQSPSLDDKLTAMENIVCQAGLYGIGRRDARQRATRWLQRLGLGDRLNERVEVFSGGMKRRVEIAKALIHEPRVLLMDEPATGLDPAALRELWDVLHELRQQIGLTIALTTHLMNEAERCNHLAILSRGRLIATDTPDALRSAIGGDIVTLEPEAGNGQPAPALDALADDLRRQLSMPADGAGVTVLDGRLHFEHPNGPRAVAEVAGAFPGRFRSLTIGRPTLEDVFVQLTGGAFADEA